MENNELVKEISRLQDLLAKHGICDDCGELYNHHIDEPLASCGCNQSEWYELTPHMKQVLELKSERDELAAQNKILLGALNLALPSVETCYKQSMATWETLFLLREAAKATPQQCLRDVQADAGRAGFIAGFDESGEGFNGEYGASDKRIHQLADDFAAKVRQGGAE